MQGKLLTNFLIFSLVLTGCVAPGSQDELVETSAPSAQKRVAFPAIENWSLDFTREQLMEESLAVAHSFFNENAGQTGQLTYYFEDSISETRRGYVTKLAEQTMSSFGGHTFDQQEIIAGSSQAFMTKTILEEGFQIPPQGDSVSLCGIPVWEDQASGCTWQNVAWLGYGEVPEQESHALHNFIPHELFHNVQANLAGGTEVSSMAPNWFMEGSAEFIGYAMTDYLEMFRYRDIAYEDWYYLPNPITGLAFWANPPGSRGIPLENYYLGQMATEYIVANIGMDSMLQIWINMGAGLRFDKGFEQATGISLTKFYATFDIAYKKMISNDVSDFRTFENRICPERFNWDCSVSDYRNLEWWMLLPTKVEKPDQAENSDHGAPLEQGLINFTLENCSEIANMLEFAAHNGAVAISFAVMEALGIEASVSSEWYSRQSHLDINSDGVICGPGD